MPRAIDSGRTRGGNGNCEDDMHGRWDRQLLGRDPDLANKTYRELCETIIAAQGDREAASSWAVAVLDLLDGASDPKLCGRLLLLLGLLSEPSDPTRDPVDPEDPARSVVLGGLDRYLGLYPLAENDRGLLLALFYLLAHFPERAERILEVVGGTDDSDALTRLTRSLETPDLDDPGIADEAGRAWPSPAILAFNPEEIASTATARRAFSAEQVATLWRGDSLALLAYAGGYASAALGA
jgi:hypothetical protein